MKRILIIGIPGAIYEKLLYILRDYEVSRALKGEEALQLLATESFSLIISHYPLQDLLMQDLLEDLRNVTSLNRTVSVILLSHPTKLEEAHTFVGEGVNQVYSITTNPRSLYDDILRLLDVEPRVTHRVMAFLQNVTDSGLKDIVCQTENLSFSGMLLRSDEYYPVGSIVRFEFTLPVTRELIQGEAEVVRHTSVSREAFDGMALKFVKLERSERHKLKRYFGKDETLC